MKWAELKREFDRLLRQNRKIKKILSKKTITYRDANTYAIEVGNIMGRVLSKKENFPDGITYEEALEILSPALTHSYKLAREAALKAQKTINRKAGLNLNPSVSKPKADLIPGIAKEIVSRGGIEGFEKKLADQIGRFTMNGVDDTVSVNAYETKALGLAPKVVRVAEADCCEWCSDLEGEYEPEEAERLGVYRRHDNCRCTVEYVVGNVSETVHTGKEGKIKYRTADRNKRIKNDQQKNQDEKRARAERVAKEKLDSLRSGRK